ncbi:MAG: type IV toxin-antitoxin system AbiEi family antitoxin domain-containing protein [Bacilli bacterium]|jgi:predicted transcriptional regulator of viral defense system
MEYASKIIEKMESSGGIITSEEIRNSNIPTIYLTRLVESGDIIRATRGIYILPDGYYDEYYFFQNRHNVAIFSYVSALYLHDLTDVIPSQKEITVYKGYNPHRIDEKTRVHYVNKEIYDFGITEIETAFGNVVKVYDLERTICDFVKDRGEIDVELFSKTINSYIRSEKKNLMKLYEYSKKMKIYEKVKEVLEVLDA